MDFIEKTETNKIYTGHILSASVLNLKNRRNAVAISVQVKLFRVFIFKNIVTYSAWSCQDLSLKLIKFTTEKPF